jgi:hypothetical protein
MPQKQRYQKIPPPSQNRKRGKRSATQLKIMQYIPTVLYFIYNTNYLGKTTKPPQASNNNTIQSPNRSNNLTELQFVIAYKKESTPPHP